MKILLTAATAGELAFFNPAQPFPALLKIDTAITGVGAMHTAFNLMYLIGKEKPDLIIQTGIAGCFSPHISIGSAVAVNSELIADLGVWEKDRYRDIFDMGFTEPDTPPYTGKRLLNPHRDTLQSSNLPVIDSVTVNRITTDPADIALFRNQYAADIESMEGAALHYVCLLQRIPFIQIRGISNSVGERDKTKWQINEAMYNAIKAIYTLLNNLNPQP